MPKRNYISVLSIILLITLLLATATVFSACAKKGREEPVILEPGLPTDEPNVQDEPDSNDPLEGEEETPEEDFIDMDRASTLDDLMANKEKIHSYYFEQNISASYGDMLVKTWYADGWMKIASIFGDGEENIEYFDCGNLILVSCASVDDYGMMMTFEPGDPDIPKNHLTNDYHQFRVEGTDSIGGQTCRILLSREGEKLWVSTKYGFPLQVEFTDPTNDEHFIISYDNLTINTTDYEEVAIPDDLVIYRY